MRALAIALVLAGAVAHAGEPAVDPEAPSLRVLAMKNGRPALKPRVKVGEPFHIVVTVTPKPDEVIGMPASFDTGTFEVLDRKEAPVSGTTERAFDLTVVAWEPGEQKFPPIPVTYVPSGQGQVKQISTRELGVAVVAVLGEDRDAKLRPIAPPVPVLRKDWTLVYVAGGAAGTLLLGAGVMFAARAARRRRRKAVVAAPVVDLRPPREVALEKLHALARSGLADAADRRPYYFALTEIVREFLGRRFGFAALDMTTSELLEALAAAPADLRAELAAWLGDCDLVKFARRPATRNDAAAALDAAVRLVERGAPAPVPVVEEARAG